MARSSLAGAFVTSNTYLSVVTGTTATPEPGMVVLMVVGLVGLLRSGLRFRLPGSPA
ncbi:hypothetical protein SBA4_4430012 [Candidatus Sulfopaludibacter sp. SbA4]|nr:hypothetical protein SBA4_4430012 [Candidatus Sulfopaludibacter sp. SbA4]